MGDGLLTVSLPLYFPSGGYIWVYMCVYVFILGIYNYEVHEARDEFAFHKQFGF